MRKRFAGSGWIMMINFTTRKIQERDLELIMCWRMDPEVTRYMFTDPVLTLKGQYRWLKEIEEDTNVKYWMIEVDENPVGVINLININWEKKISSWGYYIGNKEYRSLLLAISLEMSLFDYVFNKLGFIELHNEVLSLNDGVIKLHIACGEHIVYENIGEVEKKGIKYDVTHMSITNQEWNLIRNSKKYKEIKYD